MSNETAMKELVDLARDELKDQSDTRRLLTMKASIMIGISIYLVTHGIEIYQEYDKSILFISVILSFLSIICGFVSIRIQFDEMPNLERARDFKNSKHEETLGWIFDTIEKSVETNHKNIVRSSSWFFWGLYSLVLATFIYLAAFFSLLIMP